MPTNNLRSNTHRTGLYSLLLFVFFSALFILLRSNDPLAADGAFRCFSVFRDPRMAFAENNHALYPANIFVWTRLARFAGFNIASPQGFYSVAELMNCFAAAGCLTLFFQLSLMATLSNAVALAVTFGLALTRAFLLHATNASEPMVAIFWSFLAVYLAARTFKTASRWTAFFSGVFFALAMATYQTAVLFGPVAVLILWRSARPKSPSRALPSRLLTLAAFGGGAAIGSIAIYGCIANFRLHSASAGATSASVISGFFSDPGTVAYLNVSSSKLLNLPLGFLRNSYPVLVDFTGIRNFLRGSLPSVASVFFLLAAFTAFGVYYAFRIAGLWKVLESRTRTAILCGVVGVAFTLVPLLVWDPQYDKFWIQPLACLIFLLGISFQALDSRFARPFFLARVIPALLLAGLLFNFSWVLRSHMSSIVELAEARRLSTLVARGDLVVGDWNGVSVLYHYAWLPPDTKFISFPSDAIRQGPRAILELEQSIQTTLASGGRVFFIGLLDNSKQSWDSFLGLRCGIPYSALDYYRTHSVPYASFETRYGAIVLKQLDLPRAYQSRVATH